MTIGEKMQTVNNIKNFGSDFMKILRIITLRGVYKKTEGLQFNSTTVLSPSVL